MEGWRFNPPRSWPVEAGYEPERGWRPPADWGPLPPGHRLWLPEHPQSRRKGPSVLALLGVAGLVAAAILVPPVSGGSDGDVVWPPDTSMRAEPVSTAPPARPSPSPRVKRTHAVRRYSSCAELRAVYPHGVGRRSAHDRATGPKVTTFRRDAKVYAANRPRDGDGDGIACEQP